MTASSFRSKPTNDAYESNFDRIFGTKEERKARREKEKAEAAEKQAKMAEAVKTAYISGTFEPFKSPIDGSVISDPSKLREHNKRHEVADIREYGDEYFKKRGEEMYREKIGADERNVRERKQKLYEVLKYHKIIR